MKLPKHRQKIVFTVTLFAALFSACATGGPEKPASEGPKAGDHTVVPFVGSTKVNRYTLDNGLRILVIEDHSSPTFAYHTWFRVGSRNEVPGYTGLAHLFEHMMYKGTTKHPEGEMEKILDSAGAEGTNAFTTKDYTAYIQELPNPVTEAPSGSLDLIMGLESDRMVNLVVNDESFKTEVGVVQNERRLRFENNPDGLMYNKIYEVAYTKHPYRWPVIGFTEDLDRMTSEDARKFYKQYYAPNSATVIVSGDVKADDVYEKAKHYYGGLPVSIIDSHVIEPEPPQTSPRRKDLQLDLKVEKLYMAYHIPSVTGDEIPALGMLQSILTGGKSSRLHRALVETGIATSVSADQMDDHDPGLFMFVVSLQKGKRAAVAESVILKELAKLAAKPVGADELERARNLMSFSFLQGIDSNSERCHLLGHYESVAGDFQVGLRNYERSLVATPEEIQSATKKYLDPNNRSTVTGVPKK
jgi:zinc protease